MPIEYLNYASLEEEINRCVHRERQERAAAAAAVDMSARDAHMGLAERYADRARLLRKQVPGPAFSSDPWSSVGVGSADSKPSQVERRDRLG